METKFKAKKATRYFQIDYVSGLINKPNHYADYVWCISKNEAREFVRRAGEIESNIKKILNDKQLEYDFRLIMCLCLPVIESISSGFDIRKDVSSPDLAEGFVKGYQTRYEKAYEFCEQTLDHVEKIGKFDSYMKDWRRYDRHNDLVREFNLPLKKLELEDFGFDEIKSMEDALDSFHKLFDERKTLRESKNI